MGLRLMHRGVKPPGALDSTDDSPYSFDDRSVAVKRVIGFRGTTTLGPPETGTIQRAERHVKQDETHCHIRNRQYLGTTHESKLPVRDSNPFMHVASWLLALATPKNAAPENSSKAASTACYLIALATCHGYLAGWCRNSCEASTLGFMAKTETTSATPPAIQAVRAGTFAPAKFPSQGRIMAIPAAII